VLRRSKRTALDSFDEWGDESIVGGARGSNHRYDPIHAGPGRLPWRAAPARLPKHGQNVDVLAVSFTCVSTRRSNNSPPSRETSSPLVEYPQG
jgi:hypothetical protein